MMIKFELIVNMNEPESEHELVDMLRCVSFIKHSQHSLDSFTFLKLM